jgi:hypothetical protein
LRLRRDRAIDIDAAFLPLADTLINSVFPTPIVYHEKGTPTYDPLSGAVTGADVDHNINAGVLSRSRTEEGGTAEKYELLLWVEHKTLPILPKTGDSVTYDGTRWNVVEVAPTYSSKSLIASRLTARAA